jgi:hypothetical protein
MAGVPLSVVREVVGHSRASVTFDVYSHVLMDEPPELLAERRALVMERRGGDVSVMSRAPEQDPETALSQASRGSGRNQILRKPRRGGSGGPHPRLG